MKKIHAIIISSILLYNYNIFAQTIAIVNIQYLIDNNPTYLKTLKEIELNQSLYLKEFENKENDLKINLKKIEDSKFIVNQNEINLQIDEYNKELTKFSNLVDEFNSHYQYQIFKIRDTVLEQIIVLLEEYANDNNIDLILDSTSYLIASNSLDITEIIKNNLNKLNLKLEYKKFEKY